ncbi:hypothetical protein VTO73DRAFT_8895 [Trametes versicolor]
MGDEMEDIFEAFAAARLPELRTLKLTLSYARRIVSERRGLWLSLAESYLKYVDEDQCAERLREDIPSLESAVVKILKQDG